MVQYRAAPGESLAGRAGRPDDPLDRTSAPPARSNARPASAVGDPASGSFLPRDRACKLNIMFGMIWSIFTLPFRIVGWSAALAGRLAGLAVGFALMVLGVAIGAGPSAALGIPIFVVGLLLTLRSLG